MKNKVDFQWKSNSGLGNYLVHVDNDVIVSVLYCDFDIYRGFSASVSKRWDISKHIYSEATENYPDLMLWIDRTIDEVRNL